MSTLLAALAGYLVGSLPTAGALARLRGIDLRAEGSGNPGANNALRTGGPVLAGTVLAVEAAKGYLAVWLGGTIADDTGAVAAGIAAVAGNVFNVWYRFRGGKGLGISLGVLAGAWPLAIPPVLVVMVATVLITRSAGLAALAAIATLLALSLIWPTTGWPTGGVEPGPGLTALAAGMAATMAWKHWRDSPLNPEWRLRTPESG